MLEVRNVGPMKIAKIGYIVMSILFCIFGITLIVVPETSITVIALAIGIGMILFGIIKLIGYFSKDLYRLAFQYDLAFGILLITLGVIVLLKPVKVIDFICVLLGIAVLTDGLYKIQISIDAKDFGIKLWWLIIIEAISTSVVGILLITMPSNASKVLTILIGVSTLIMGLLNLSTVLTAVKIIKHQKKDYIDASYEDDRKD